MAGRARLAAALRPRSLSAEAHLTRTTSGCSANPQRPADTHAAAAAVCATRRARSARTPGPHMPIASAQRAPEQQRRWAPSARPSRAVSAQDRGAAAVRLRSRASGWPAARRRVHTSATRARRASDGTARRTRTSRAGRRLRARRAHTASRSAGQAGCTATAAGGRGRRRRAGRRRGRWRWQGGGCKCSGGHGRT